MIWYLCFAVSACILCASVLYAVLLLKKYRSGMLLTPVRAIFAGIFLAVFVGLVPMFVVILKGEPGYLLKLFIYDILQTIQVFTINVGSDLILDHINSSATAISGVYSTYMTCLFFVAPILTFGFLISLLKNVLADLFYKLHFWGDVYAFSELNEKSLMLAQSIRSGSRKALIVFTNVDRDGGDAGRSLEGGDEAAGGLQGVPAAGRAGHAVHRLGGGVAVLQVAVGHHGAAAVDIEFGAPSVLASKATSGDPLVVMANT